MANGKIPAKGIIIITIGMSVSVPSKGYAIYDLTNETDFNALITNGFMPINAYINGDSLALEAQVQNYGSWYITLRNWHTSALTATNIAVVMGK